MSNSDAVIEFKTKIKNLFGKEIDGEKEYDNLRLELMTLLESYADNPFDLKFMKKATKLIDKFDDLANSEISNEKASRSRSNNIYLAAQSKRVNYASYLAGKASEFDDIDGHTKASMHNAVADGALTLFDTLSSLHSSLSKSQQDKTVDSSNIGDIIYIYSEAAYQDAVRFLDFSDKYCPRSAVTEFNKARSSSYIAKSESDIRHCINQIKSIKCSNKKEIHPAETVWHSDNLLCFETKDRLFSNAVRKYAGKEGFDEIRSHLVSNKNQADDIVAALGYENMWQGINDSNGSNRGIAMLITGATGSLCAVAAAVIGVYDPEGLMKFTELLHEIIVAHANVIDSAAAAELGNSFTLASADVGGGGVLQDVLSARLVGGGGLL